MHFYFSDRQTLHDSGLKCHVHAVYNKLIPGRLFERFNNGIICTCTKYTEYNKVLLAPDKPSEVHIPKLILYNFVTQWVTSELQEPRKILCLDNFYYPAQSFNFKRFLELPITMNHPQKA